MSGHVKICPTCGAENAAVAQRCACGAFLIGVDVVERPTPDPMADAPAPEAAPSPVPAQQPAAAPAPADAVAPPRPAAAAAAPDVLTCPHADCGQPNPPGSPTCLYCNRPLAAVSVAPGPTAAGASREPPSTSPKRATAAGNTTPGAARRSLIQLPPALAERLEIVEPLKASGGEADLFVVLDRTGGTNAVLKLYRHGVEPKTDVLERVSRGAPDQIVHLIDFGVADGVPYELLEYCEHGSLRALLKGRPVPPDAARTVLTELADAIAHLHGHGIVHRDLKPENVLVRGLLPLDLVLTDFGISSVAEATMHYTSAARTLRYSAPETGSNWVGKPSDYWSLGMMIAEALAGRHPYEGLSEAVIAHQLVTKPVDLAGVADERWRLLCRGLLTRDPKQRWGDAEIRRWLGGEHVAVADETEAAAVAAELRPYRIEGEECRTSGELAVALARHWSTGAQDLRRGILRSWIQNDLRDQDLTRFVLDLEEDPTADPDEKLLRLLQRLDPGLPPVFQGHDVSRAGLAALAGQALAEDGEARHVVATLLERRTLRLFPAPELQAVHGAYEEACERSATALQRARAAGAPAALAAEGREWSLQLFAAAVDPSGSIAARMREQVAAEAAGAARRCPWFAAIADPAVAVPGELALLVAALPAAVRAGVDVLAAQARAGLARIALTVEGNPRLASFEARLRELGAHADGTLDEPAVLRLVDAADGLEREVGTALEALWAQEVFVARRIEGDEHLRRLRARLCAYARQRAGERYADFGDRIEITTAIGRRAYTVRLDTQIESRRSPYKYSDADQARMPAGARATVADPWSCAMPALPCHAADFRMGGRTQVRCPRCGQEAAVKLNEGWGAKTFLFATVYACHDRVGVQTQTRSITAEERVRPPFVPAEVADLVEALATEETSPERSLEVVLPRIEASVLDAIPDGPVKEVCGAFVAAAQADCEDGHRITAQRLRLRWTGVTEVRYRHEGRDWVLWVPARIDRKPIDFDSPLPKEPPPEAARHEPTSDEVSERAPDPAPAVPMPAPTPLVEPTRAGTGVDWLRHLAIWGAIVLVLWFVVRGFLH